MYWLRHNLLLRSATVEGSGGTATPPAPAAEPASFSVDYVRELRAENKGYRLKAASLETAASEAKAAAEKAAADLAALSTKAAKEVSDAVAAANTAAAQRLIRAEIRAGAKEAGLTHNDFLKLIDTSAVTVDKDGDVVVPADFWTSAKAANPHLFAATGADRGTTTQTTPPPKSAPAAGRHVKEMTDEEAAAAEAALIRPKR